MPRPYVPYNRPVKPATKRYVYMLNGREISRSDASDIVMRELVRRAMNNGGTTADILVVALSVRDITIEAEPFQTFAGPFFMKLVDL